MRFAILLALMCVCTSYTLAAKEDVHECKYTNAKGGLITPFFMDKYKFSPYPCTLLLARITCGNITGVVEILNTASSEEEFNTRITKVTVKIEHTLDGVDYTDTNILTSDNKNAFLDPSKKDKKARKTEEGKKEASKKLWNWSSDPERKRGDDAFIGTYEETKKKGTAKKDQFISLLVKAYDFEVEIKTRAKVSKKPTEDDDEIIITCPSASFKGGRNFPRSLCGIPENTEEDIKTMLKGRDNSPNYDSSDAAWDMAQLSKMDVVQVRSECIKAKDLLLNRCDDQHLVPVMVDCHSYFSQQVGKNYYANCARRQGKKGDEYPEPINPFKLYQLCVLAQCEVENIKHANTSKTFTFTKEDCGLLNKVSKKCGNLQHEGYNIGTLVNIGKCTSNKEHA